jgi:tetratricopeptide (TPR) repeat protein
VGPDRASVLLYEKALGMDPGTPPSPAELAQSLLARALVELNSGQLSDAAQTADRARTLAVEAQLGREAGEACAILGILANMRGEWPDAYRVDFEASVRRTPELASYVFDAHTCLAEYALVGPAGHEQFIGLASELAATAREHESVHGSAIGELLTGEIALLSGRLDDARSRLEAALLLHKEAGATSGEVLTLQRLAEVALASGDREHADDLLDAALPMATTSWLEPHLMVRTHALLVDAARTPADGVGRVEAADRHLDGANVCPPCSLGYLVAAAKALAGTGALQQSRRRLEQAERISGLWPGGAAHASIWEARAVVSGAQGDHERARAFWREAADRFAEVGRPLDRDRCLAGAAS